MPVVSKSQGAFLGIHHPGILRKWKKEGASTSTAGLPEHVEDEGAERPPSGMGKKKGILAKFLGKKGRA